MRIRARDRRGAGRRVLAGGGCALLLLLGASAWGQAPAPEPGVRRAESRILADRLVHRTIDGKRVTLLYGNVFVDRDTVSVRSDSARTWLDSQIYEFMGRVRARQNDIVLTCQRAEYRRDDGAADFDGGVRIEQGDNIGTAEHGESRHAGQLLRLIGEARLVMPEYTVWADTIVRDAQTRQGEAIGHVKIVDPSSRTLVTGDHAVFAADGRSASVDVAPILTSRDMGAEAFEAHSGTMRFWRDDQRVVMVDSVRIRQGRTTAAADTALAYGTRRLVLRGEPQVQVGEQSTLTGREIEFLYHEGQLDRIFLRGQARMEDSAPDSLAKIYAGLPALDVLNGDTITVNLRENKIQRSVTVGKAHNLYVPIDVEDEIAVNDVSGDTIVINFRHERVNRVFVTGDMTGSYRFARLDELKPVKAKISLAAAAGDTTAHNHEVGNQVETMPALSGADTTGQTRAEPNGAAAAAGMALTDTTRRTYDFQNQAQTVQYSGHSVLFQLERQTIEILQNVDLKYETLHLTAGKVRFHTISRELYASGDPVLEDQSEKITGEQMGYDFDYRTGAVESGVTTFEGYFYNGKEIKRYADGSLKIQSATMTSCDLEQPHYHFWSDKMKIQMKEKVVAKPVVLMIGRVPVFALPYYFKSLKSGRRSGILFPSFNFGWSQRTGRYVRDFGYYWATNDYTDFLFEGDYNERREFSYRIRNQYVRRYGFRGSLSYARSLSLGGQPKSRQWQLQWSHDQQNLFDAYTFRASVQMASRTLARNDLSQEIERDIVSGQLHSSAYVSRSWSFATASLNLTRDEEVNATDDDPVTDNQLYRQVLPSLQVSFKRQPLLSQLPAGVSGTFLGDLLRNTYFDHRYTLSLDRQKNERTTTTTRSGSGSWSLTVQPPRLWIFNVSTGARGSQSWQRVQRTGTGYGPVPVSLYGWPGLTDLTRSEQGFYPLNQVDETTNPSLSVGTSLGSTLYGIFPLQLGRLRAIRHTVSFTSSYSFYPALGSKQPRSESYSFSLGQRFDVKYLKRSAADTTERYGKLDGLLDWSLQTSYNPNAAPRQRWSNIGSSVSIKPGQSRNLDFKVGNVIDPYRWRIVSTNLTYGFNATGRLDTGSQAVAPEPQKNLAIDRLGAGADTTATMVEGVIPLEEQQQNAYDNEFAGGQRPVREPGGSDPTEQGRYIPWNLSLALSYQRDNDRQTSSARSNLTLSTALSSHWDFSYQASFDLDRGSVLNQSWSLNRDLHCWRLEFRRSLYADDQVFGFRIYLRAIPAIKLTRGQEDQLGGLGQFGGGIF